LSERYNIESIIGTDVTDDTYDRMPVSNFGLNLLKEMGWYEGRGVGKNT